MSRLPRFRLKTPATVKLYSEAVGQGKNTIVFIPGLGGTTRYWGPRLGTLTDRHRVVLVDILGFGQSPKPWTQYSVERHVSELRATLETLGPITLVGHSLGALITIAYAAQYPGDVNHIVLLGMPYFGSQQRAYDYMRQGPVKGGFLFTNVILTMATCVLTRRVLGRILPRLLGSMPHEVAEDLVTHTWRSSTSSLWEVVYRYDAASDLNRLPSSLPVLFIHGDQDVTAPIAAIQNLAAQKPHWQLKVLKQADHHPFLREPDRCLALIEALVSANNAFDRDSEQTPRRSTTSINYHSEE